MEFLSKLWNNLFQLVFQTSLVWSKPCPTWSDNTIFFTSTHRLSAKSQHTHSRLKMQSQNLNKLRKNKAEQGSDPQFRLGSDLGPTLPSANIQLETPSLVMEQNIELDKTNTRRHSVPKSSEFKEMEEKTESGDAIKQTQWLWISPG